jgi:hypothetical protein
MPNCIEKVSEFMDVKDRALQEIRVVDDLFRRLQLAQEFCTEMEVTVIEAEIDSHIQRHPDLVKSLLTIGDLESFGLIHGLECHRRDFITRRISAADLSQIPSSSVELEISLDDDHNNIYEPVDSSSQSRQSQVSADFCASLTLTLFVCIVFSVLWSVYAN